MKPSRHPTPTILLGLAALVVALPAARCEEDQAGFRFAGIIGDGMVIQQEKPIKIWGWAKPGAEVSVTLTEDAVAGKAAEALAVQQGSRKEDKSKDDEGYSVTIQYLERNPPKRQPQTVAATAGADGRWMAEFNPLKASFQPLWIISEQGDQTLAVRDVLIGEVWVCAGQSNMGWSNFNRKARVAQSSDCPGLRYVAWHDSWYKPLEDLRKNPSWQACTPEAAPRFSAVPYLYGMFLQRYLKVPVGIINVARGGTTGDAWCLRDELDALEHVTVTETLRKYDAETATRDQAREVERIMKDWKHIEDNASWQVLPQPYQGKAPIEGFIIAGKDRRWYPAKAREKKIDGTWTIEVWSELVENPVAVRYGWANWPTGNLVGRERLPVPTFRTDDWPIVEGVSYSPEARQAASENIKALQEKAIRQALDRKVRQLQLDLPALEGELHKGDLGGMLHGKLGRITAILDELENDRWLNNALRKNHPEVLEQAAELRKTVHILKDTVPAD